MIIQDKNTEEQLYFVVEEAQFNLGNYDKAIQMINMTSLTGADAIEFQLAIADDFYIRSEPGYAIYKTREFSDEQLQKLVTTAHQNKLHFVATCLSYKLVRKMAALGADAFNINAGLFFLFLKVSKNVFIVSPTFFLSSPKSPCNQ